MCCCCLRFVSKNFMKIIPWFTVFFYIHIRVVCVCVCICTRARVIIIFNIQLGSKVESIYLFFLFIRPRICTRARSFSFSLTHSFTHSFIHSFIHSFAHSLFHSFILFFSFFPIFSVTHDTELIEKQLHYSVKIWHVSLHTLLYLLE